MNWIKIGDAPEHGRYINSTKEKIRPEGLAKTRQVQPGDLILSNSMSFGRPYIMGIHGCIHDGWLLIRDEHEKFDLTFLCHMLGTDQMLDQYRMYAAGSTVNNLNKELVGNTTVSIPSKAEQKKIGQFFEQMDDAITLHHRDYYHCFYNSFGSFEAALTRLQEVIMLESVSKNDFFCDYYLRWITVYKEGAIRKITMEKYRMTHSWIKRLAPDLKVGELTRVSYHELLNEYAKSHEKQTTMDFHHQLKCAILDAVDEGLIDRDPTRKAIIKGKTPRNKKPKYLNQYELHQMLDTLKLGKEADWEWFILLVAKTGMRFSEALALTPADFDFGHQMVSVNKTYNYKDKAGGFLPTKNKTSVRKIQIDWRTVVQFSELIKGIPEDKPIFVSKKPFNSTVNGVLARHCKQAGVPVITIHGLRHTHASILLFAGVSIASVARRLGHSSMNTTQKTYLHIIQELENKDINIVMRSLSELD